MRLTLKLTFGILLGVGLTLLGNVMLRAERESNLLESDIKKDHLVLGHALSVDVVEEWRDRGRDAAMALVSKMNSERAGIDISAADVDALPADVQAALLATRPPLPLQRLAGDGADEHLTTWLPLTLHGRIVAAMRIDEPFAPARAYVHSSMERTAVSALIGFTASALLAFVFGFLLVGRPVRKLVDKARRTGLGDFSGPLPQTRSDELGLLAAELNAMCERLALARAQLTRATEQRIAAIQQLRHADRLSTVGLLAAGIAHELGTPLNIVAGRARLIADAPVAGGAGAGASEAGRHGTIIAEQAERMTRIVRQLLEFARGGRKPHKTRVALAPAARETVDMLQALAQKRGVALVVVDDGAGHECDAYVDAGQLQQALTNLVVNAIHASGKGQRVRVRVGAAPDSAGGAFVSVLDEGVGMDDETLRNLFTPFFTTKDVGEGTGLGLAVAWGLIEENGGHITVTSEKGRGSTFTIHLAPDAPAAAAATPPTPASTAAAAAAAPSSGEPVAAPSGGSAS